MVVKLNEIELWKPGKWSWSWVQVKEKVGLQWMDI